MFRYQDENNHYRFIWYREKNSRRLERRVNGKFYTLSEDAVPYKPGQTYELEIIATGKNLKVRIDDSDIFYDVDSSLTWGTVALYTGFNAGSYFDDVHVQDLTGATLLREDFNDGRANGWAIVDAGDLVRSFVMGNFQRHPCPIRQHRLRPRKSSGDLSTLYKLKYFDKG